MQLHSDCGFLSSSRLTAVSAHTVGGGIFAALLSPAAYTVTAALVLAVAVAVIVVKLAVAVVAVVGPLAVIGCTSRRGKLG